MSGASFAVALTGGIASGKSAVAERFAARGIGIVDTDIGARDVVLPGSPGFDAVIDAFGKDMVARDGTLARRRLREHIFANTAARKMLEAILHPLIRDWTIKRVAEQDSTYVLVVVPLLAETWPAYAWVQRVLVVDAPEAVRIDRLMQRDGIDREQADRMLASQAGRQARLALADDIIDNSASADELDTRVSDLHQRYLALAGSHPH